MRELPAALSALAARRQFIVYVAVPSRARAGKTDKFPMDYRTGQVANAHDPEIWLDFETAAAFAQALGGTHGVGFVLTATDDFWFIDVDACLVAGAWSSIAQELMTRFAGAAWEISLSGTGLHGLGRGLAPSPRKVKYGTAFDLYTEGRFVALTGTSVIGDAATDHTAALHKLVADYLQPDTATTPIEWTIEPDPRWCGPADDAQLIERAMRSNTAANAFGTKASFAQLWKADPDALGRAFPPDQGGPGYDESKADAALAQHLAFWTGKNCERMQRVMARSSLAREKWTARDDYLPRTILGAVARQTDVLQDKPAVIPPPAVSAAPEPVAVSGRTILNAAEQVGLFQGCVYVRNVHRILVPGGDLLKPEQFRAMYGGYSFVLDDTNTRVGRDPYEAFIESQCVRFPKADTSCFRPELAPATVIAEGGRRSVNTWWPIETPRMAGDPTPFLDHLRKMIPSPGDRAQILAYCAAVVQYPGVKFQWAPLIQGAEGNGKTMVIRVLMYAVGMRYTHLPNTDDLSGNGLKFTEWLRGKLFVGLEEIRTKDSHDTAESLKAFITNDFIEMQGKGVDQTTGDNRANFFALSNHYDAIPKRQGDRRWAIYYCAQQDYTDWIERDGMGGDYFPKLWAWLKADGYAIMNDFLRSYAIPDELNPATMAHRAPRTSSEEAVLAASLGVLEQEVLEAIEREEPGFAGGWVSSAMIDRLFQRQVPGRRLSPRKKHELVLGLGYISHPALTGGRVNNAVKPDATKTRLYVKKGSLLAQLPTIIKVEESYERTQAKAGVTQAGFVTVGT